MDSHSNVITKFQNIRRSLWVRIVLTLLVIIAILYTVILSSLAGRGVGPFKNARGFCNIPALTTCLMPANYYYFIWILLDFSFLFIAVYAIVMVVQKFVLGHGKKQCGTLPLPFLAVLFISLNLNTGWLFAEDKLNSSWSFIVSMLLFISNCIALAYTTYNFSMYAISMHRESIMDFWMGIGVVNAMAVYTTWSLVQFLKSFTVFLAFEAKVEKEKACLAMLIVLQLFIVTWFILENTTLTYSFNTVALHYVVLVWYAATLYPKQIQKASSTIHAILITNVVLAVVALFLRLVILSRRNRHNSIYRLTTPPTAIIVDTQ